MAKARPYEIKITGQSNMHGFMNINYMDTCLRISTAWIPVYVPQHGYLFMNILYICEQLSTISNTDGQSLLGSGVHGIM